MDKEEILNNIVDAIVKLLYAQQKIQKTATMIPDKPSMLHNAKERTYLLARHELISMASDIEEMIKKLHKITKTLQKSISSST